MSIFCICIIASKACPPRAAQSRGHGTPAPDSSPGLLALGQLTPEIEKPREGRQRIVSDRQFLSPLTGLTDGCRDGFPGLKALGYFLTPSSRAFQRTRRPNGSAGAMATARRGHASQDMPTQSCPKLWAWYPTDARDGARRGYARGCRRRRTASPPLKNWYNKIGTPYLSVFSVPTQFRSGLSSRPSNCRRRITSRGFRRR